jgi:iron(III) transport system permease protein
VVLFGAALALTLGYPLFILIRAALNTDRSGDEGAFEFGFGNFLRLADHWPWIWNTLYLSACGTAAALVIGVGLAWILQRTTAPRAGLFEVLITATYPLGPLVSALAWAELAGPQAGLINILYRTLTGSAAPLVDVFTPTGIIFVLAVSEAPVAVMIVGAAMQRMDPSLEEQSAVSGVGRWGTAFKVTLPLMMPAILSAGLFLLTSMMGALAVPAILGINSRTYVATTAIYVLFQGYPPDYGLAAAVGTVLIGSAALGVWLNRRILRGRSYAVISGKSYRPRRLDVGRWTWVLTTIQVLYVLVTLVLPISALVFVSIQASDEIRWLPRTWTLDNFRYVIFEHSTAWHSIFNSVVLGILTGLFGLLLATPLAWLVHRSKAPGRGLLEQLAMLPQSFPRLIFAFALMWAFLTLPIPLYGTLAAVLVAYVIVLMPLSYRGMAGVVVQLHPSLEEAARVHGATWSRSFRTITAPLLKPGMVATWALLFMVSVREVSASYFLTSPSTPVLGPTILNFWQSGGISRVSALAIIQAGIIVACMLVARRLSNTGAQVQA